MGIRYVKGCVGLDGEREIIVNLLHQRFGLPHYICVRFLSVPGCYVSMRPQEETT